MEPLRPKPMRPYASKRATESHDENAQAPLKQSKSFADISSLSRTSSFLSFTGLESLKASALFGIFERSGLDKEPATPDPSSQYDFQLAPTPSPLTIQEQTTLTAMTLTKLAGVAAASFAFIVLFNQIPNNNRFCAISSSQAIPPVIYVLLATSIALIYPFLDTKLKLYLPTKNKISSPIEKDSQQNANTREYSRESREENKSLPFNVLLRYFAGLLGLAYAGTKLDFSQSSQFNLCVCAISLAVQLILDRTLRGLILSVLLGMGIASVYAVIMKTPTEEIAGVASLVWLNVSVYGSLGKILKICP